MRAWLLVCGISLGFVMLASGCDNVANKTFCDGTAQYPCSDPAKPFCDVAKKTCVATDPANPDMPMTDAGVPDMPSGGDQAPPDLVLPDLAPECTSSAQCTSAAAPICGDGKCRACTSSTEDVAECVAKNHVACVTTGANAGQCGECDPNPANSESASCGATKSKPICNELGQCVGCTAHAQCNSKICLFESGTCATNVVRVARTDCRSGSSADDTSKPWCELHLALSGATAPADGAPLYVLVESSAGSTNPEPYQSVTIDNTTKNRKAVIVGSGMPVVLSTGQPGLTISATGAAMNSVDITVDGVTFGSTMASRLASAGISCSGQTPATAKLTLRNVLVQGVVAATQDGSADGISLNACTTTITNSTITANAGTGIAGINGATTLTSTNVTNNGKEGIALTNGMIRIAQSRVANNKGGGISIGGTPNYQLVNLLVYRNGAIGAEGSLYGGLQLNSKNGFVANATVYGNSSLGSSAAGIACAVPDTVVLNTVVFDSAGGTDLATICSLQSSAYKGITATRDLTSCTAANLFLDANLDNYKLKTNGTTPCTLIDGGAASSGAATAPSIDYEGAARPQGAAADIGAYEALAP